MGYIVYHISHNSNRASILEKGLELRGRNGHAIKYEPRICVSISKKILFFDWIDPTRDNIDVWQIEDEQPLFPDIFMSSRGHFFLKEPVHPERIKLIKCY